MFNIYYKKNNNKALFKEFKNIGIDNIQNYIPSYRHFFNLRYLPKIKDLVQAIGCRFDSCLEHILNQQATNASLTGVKINNKQSLRP